MSAQPQAVQRVFEAARAGDMAGAKRLAVEALGAGHEHPALLNLRALDHEENGRLDAALADLTRAQALSPADFSILNARGLCLARLGRLGEAAECYEAALALRADFAPAWFNLGVAKEQLGETAEAAAAYARAAELQPGHVQAWANLAWLASRRGDAAGAAANAERAFALQPGNVTAALALAAIELTEPATAEARLRGLLARADLTPYDHALALGQLGDALDAQSRPTEAFAAYAQSNAGFRAEAAPRFEGQTSIADTLAWLVPWAQRLDPAAWTASPIGADPGAGQTGHVFLIGFPRSGTTLIESLLAQYPDVVSLEERGTLDKAVGAFMAEPLGLARLRGLAARDLARYRDDYWARVARFGAEVRGKIFIDKNPFNTLKLPLIYKLFPDAKVIFARRDPRDVVLSCFRRRFNLNPSTFELLDLERAAAFYDGAMRIWQALRAKQPLASHTLVYERLTQDLTAEAEAVCAFIGAAWRPELADFAGRARRGEVASASSAQIARGLYDGAGQWRRYRAELAPVLPKLAPWVKAFDYPAD